MWLVSPLARQSRHAPSKVTRRGRPGPPDRPEARPDRPPDLPGGPCGDDDHLARLPSASIAMTIWSAVPSSASWRSVSTDVQAARPRAQQLRASHADRVATVVVCGMVGPRDDGYAPGARVDPDEAVSCHPPQLAACAEAGADQTVAYPLTDLGEAIGVLHARSAGRGVVHARDQRPTPRRHRSRDYFMINGARPTHLEPVLGDASAPGVPASVGSGRTPRS